MPDSRQHHDGIMYVILIVSMALWGGTWPIGRTLAATISPPTAAFLRFLLASSTLLAICRLQNHRWRAFRLPTHLWPLVVLPALTGIFGYSVLFFKGLQSIEAGRAALIIGSAPVCIALGASLLAHHLPRAITWGGILCSITGVALIVSNGHPLALLAGEIGIGDLYILGCVLCWTAYTLLARPLMRAVSPLIAVTWTCSVGCLLLLPYAWANGLWQELPSIRTATWWGLLYLGPLATSLAYFGYYHAINRIGTMAAGIFINLVPLFALLFSFLFLQEPLRLATLAGGALIITGVVITVRSTRTPRNLVRNPNTDTG